MKSLPIKILTISDIVWRITSIIKFKDLIDSVKPDLVLISGDLVDDKIYFENGKTGNRNKYWEKVYDVFEFLNDRKINTLCVRGNWDNDPFFEKTVNSGLIYIKDISDKVEVFRNVKILGLSYGFTNDLKAIKTLAEKYVKKLDIILAHAEYKRRVWLFHFDSKIIITGHFDRQFCQIKDKAFISFENFPREYALIDYLNSKQFSINYYDNGNGKSAVNNVVFAKDKFSWKGELPKSGIKYANRIQSLMDAKLEIKADKTKKSEIKEDLLKNEIPKTHIQEYI